MKTIFRSASFVACLASVALSFVIPDARSADAVVTPETPGEATPTSNDPSLRSAEPAPSDPSTTLERSDVSRDSERNEADGIGSEGSERNEAGTITEDADAVDVENDWSEHPYVDDDGEEATDFRLGPLVRNYVLRPLTTPKKTLRVFAGPGDPRMLSLSDYRGFGEYGLGAESRRLRYRVDELRVSTGTTVATLKLGAVYGITDTLELGFGLPFTFGPGTTGITDDVPIWLTGRFHESRRVELGWRLTAFAPAANRGAVQIGLPLIFRQSIFRVDSGIFGTLHFNDPLTSRVLIPVRFSISFVDAMYVGMSSGIDLRNFDALAIPLGFHVLFVLEYDNFLMDVGLSFLWPAFVHAFERDEAGSVLGPGVEDSLGQIRGRPGIDFNDFDVQLGANLAIRF